MITPWELWKIAITALSQRVRSISATCETALTVFPADYKFEEPSEPPPPQVDDEIRRKEEEELQRVLEMSMQDKGGRAHWEAYAGLSSTGAGASSSSASLGQSSSAGPSRTAGSPGGGSTVRKQSYGYPAPTVSGYVPARSPSPTPVHVAAAPAQVPVPVSSVVSFPTAAASPVQPLRSPEPGLAPAQASRVRALHTFEATEAGELSFEKGDVIKVVDRNYKDWWRGQLKGRTGIFPVNYVVSS
jgi:signal transducing adaptor molecule